MGAKAQQVARLEAELAAQAKASELRLTELQDTFAAKLGDLKATHQAQLAAQQVDADAAKAGLEVRSGGRAVGSVARRCRRRRSSRTLRLLSCLAR